MILGADGDSRCALKNAADIVKTCILCSKTEKRVFNYRIMNACFTKLFTKLCIISNIDAFIIDNNACNRIFKLLGKVCDYLFLLATLPIFIIDVIYALIPKIKIIEMISGINAKLKPFPQTAERA